MIKRTIRTYGLLAILVMVSPIAFAQDTDVELREPPPEATSAPDVLDLRTALRVALQDNPDIQAALARFRQAEQRVYQARSEYYPSLDSSATITFRRDIDNPNQSFSAVTGIPIDATSEDYRGNVTASWLFFDGFGRKFRNRFAEFGELQSEAAFDEAQRFIMGSVATAYYNVQLERENIAIAEADRAFNQRQLEETQARKDAGTGSLSDVLNFEVRIREAESSLIQARRNYRVSLLILFELLGVGDHWAVEDVSVPELENETLDQMESPDLDETLTYASTHRPDLQQARFGVEQAKAGIELNRSTFWPKVSGFAQSDASRNTNSSFSTDQTATSVSAGFQLSYNIFSGGRNRAALRESKALRDEADDRFRAVELQAIRDVRVAYQNLLTAQEQLRLQRETTQYVERNRALVDKEYQAGQTSLVRLNEAQRDLISQQARLVLARAALFERWYRMRTATGEVLENAP